MLSLAQVVEATKGRLLGREKSIRINGVSIDSRTIKKGELFIAIKGERFDGHRFIGQAIKKSAAAAVAAKKDFRCPKDFPVIHVEDTAKALGALARFYRDQFSIPVVAITGSAGKTTTKEMAAAVLGARYNVLKNAATENNHIGVPLTLLRLKSSHGAAVVELGTNHFGEIRYLTEIANPTFVILTNIGESHLESFKNLAGVFREKFQILKHLRKGATVLFNGDDPTLKKIPSKNTAHCFFSFGLRDNCDYRGDQIGFQKNSLLQFRLNDRHTILLKTPACHNVYNALAAIGCGHLLGVDFRKASQALEDFKFPDGRQALYKVGSYWLIDDTYNANPVSLRSALKTIRCFPNPGKKIFVCADMLELGRQAKELHQSMGRLAARSQLDSVVTIGKLSRFISESARKYNKHLTVYHAASVEPAFHWLKNYLTDGDVLLVKGSRRMRLERLFTFLKRKG